MVDRPRIVVLGSINMDLVATAPALPRPGQTVIGERFATAPGGKGANQAVAAARLGADALLLQLEVPLAVSIEAAELARSTGVPVIFDPAPPSELPASAYAAFDVIAPNQSEAEVLTGVSVDGVDSALDAARVLRARGAGTAIVKLGEQGVAYSAASGEGRVPAFAVEAVDTVAAGDGFASALAVALAEGQPLERAVRFAAAGGALAVTRRGAQDAMPRRAEVERLLEAQAGGR